MFHADAIVSNTQNDNDVNDPAIKPHQWMIHRIPPWRVKQAIFFSIEFSFSTEKATTVVVLTCVARDDRFRFRSLFWYYTRIFLKIKSDQLLN